MRKNTETILRTATGPSVASNPKRRTAGPQNGLSASQEVVVDPAGADGRGAVVICSESTASGCAGLGGPVGWCGAVVICSEPTASVATVGGLDDGSAGGVPENSRPIA